MQDIFHHLSDNQLKYYAPKGIWEDYRMNSEKFDLQMPYDASEFLTISLKQSTRRKLENIMGTEIQGKVTPGLLGLKSIIYQG
jgi:hypothetical protein